jgi:hypothetical protein
MKQTMDQNPVHFLFKGGLPKSRLFSNHAGAYTALPVNQPRRSWTLYGRLTSGPRIVKCQNIGIPFVGQIALVEISHPVGRPKGVGKMIDLGPMMTCDRFQPKAKHPPLSRQ